MKTNKTRLTARNAGSNAITTSQFSEIEDSEKKDEINNISSHQQEWLGMVAKSLKEIAAMVAHAQINMALMQTWSESIVRIRQKI